MASIHGCFPGKTIIPEDGYTVGDVMEELCIRRPWAGSMVRDAVRAGLAEFIGYRPNRKEKVYRVVSAN